MVRPQGVATGSAPRCAPAGEPGDAPDPLSFAGVRLDRTRVMGVVNVTPDSFSDGGEAFATDAAISRALAMVDAGADFIDIGGESTRPGSEGVAIDEELARVVPVVAALAARGVRISVDTRHPEVMAAALDAGAAIVNDITALTGDARSLPLVAGRRAGVVLMHMQGDPRTMQDAPCYDDAAADVRAWLTARRDECLAAGVPAGQIALDPGIGFGKTVDHNLRILSRLAEYRALGCALLVGVSRKSFIARLSRSEPPQGRLAGSLAAALAAVARGAHIVRVHDVEATVQALKVWSAIADPDTREPAPAGLQSR
ncbi:MAG: dihydropteroate synthase [Rhodospirillales bacterium]|nr:dihydropteroate synthase [Rhodospirillales bacterium]